MTINMCIQEKLANKGLLRISVIEANRWTAEAGILHDSDTRPGKPLRKKCRAGEIHGAKKEDGRWHIYRLDNDRSRLARTFNNLFS
jgi:hypothetical protein